MIELLAGAMAGANTFDMAMMGVNAVGAVAGLFGLGNKSKYKSQKKILDAKMKQLDTQKDILNMTTEYNVNNAKESYYTNFGRMNSEYAGTRFSLSNQIESAYDSMIMSMGNNSGIDKSEILARKADYLNDTSKDAEIRLNDEQIQQLTSLSKDNIQTLIGYEQNYYSQLSGISNAELGVMAEYQNLENSKKANQLGSIQSALGNIMNIGQIASKSYERNKLYGSSSDIPTFESNFTGLKLEKFGL